MIATRQVLAIALGACFGAVACGADAPANNRDTPPQANQTQHQIVPVLAQTRPSRAPVEIEIESARVGDSVRLDITGIGRRRTAGGALEDFRQWDVTSTANGQSLKRMVNGSARVSRHPIGGYSSELWDVEISFTVAFAVPADATSMTVRVLAPEETKPHVRTIDIKPPQPEPKPTGKKGKSPGR